MEKLIQLSKIWKENLFSPSSGVLSFWTNFSLDSKFGGYFTCLDHDGSIYDDTKYSWLQGRQVYMFARLYNETNDVFGVTDEVRATYLQAASLGVDFLNTAKDENNILYFSTTRDGSHKLHLQRKPYSAVFYVQGMLEYYRALIKYRREIVKTTSKSENVTAIDSTTTSKTTNLAAATTPTLPPPAEHLSNPEQFFGIALDMFDRLLAWIEDSSLCGRPKVQAPPSSKGTTALADIMCAASLALDFIQVIDEEKEENREQEEQSKALYQKHQQLRPRFIEIIRSAMKNCLRHYDTRNNRNIFLESVSGTGISSNTPSGRLFCPGHSIEVAWFLFKMCDVVGSSQEYEHIALSVLEGSLKNGWDKDEYGGGILYMKDIENKPLVDATVTSNGKLWWPHTEALIALTMAYTRTKDDKWLVWLEKVHNYSYKTFVTVKINESTKIGEWFGYANRDGTLARTSKGGNYKGCFHVPRALLMCIQEVDKFLKDH